MGRSKDLASGNSAAYVETAGDTMTGNLLLGSNSIGLGTTSPDAKIHVEGSILVDAFNAGNETGIFFREGFTSSNKYNHSILVYDDDGSPDGISINGYGGVSICTGSNSRQERFKVDNSGRVTTPNQPFIECEGNSNSSYSYSADQVIAHWSNKTTPVGITRSGGRFTVPVAGKYLFCFTLYSYVASTGHYRNNIKINGSIHSVAQMEVTSTISGGPYDHTLMSSHILNMSANDYVEIIASDAQQMYRGVDHNALSMMLIG